MIRKLPTLTAAVPTPFAESGELALAVVERQATHLLEQHVASVFVGGTTGECHSLTVEERFQLSERWCEVAKGTELAVVIHVGANALGDARALAGQAERLKATAIAAVAPSYFKPPTVEVLVECCATIAASAPSLPFYYYDIPSLTGLRLPAPEFLERAAERIPNLAGIKFSNPDLAAYQSCIHFCDGRFDIPWGTDEYLLAALAVGGSNAVGSSYNFAGPLYHRLLRAFAEGDLPKARREQFQSVRLIELLGRFGYLAALKEVLMSQGVAVGPVRLPLRRLSPPEVRTLLDAFAAIGIES